MSKTLYYDDGKDLTEGLITENDDGVWSQVAQVFPNFREEYGHKFVASPRMADLLQRLVTDGWSASISEEAKEILAKVNGEG